MPYPPVGAKDGGDDDDDDDADDVPCIMFRPTLVIIRCLKIVGENCCASVL
jgi:hypothetical protein